MRKLFNSVQYLFLDMRVKRSDEMKIQQHIETRGIGKHAVML